MACTVCGQEVLHRLRQDIGSCCAPPRKWFQKLTVAKVLYWIAVRVYVLLLVFFMLAIWRMTVDPDTAEIWVWLAWLDGIHALIPSAVIIGLVQVVAIILFTVRHMQRYGRCCDRRGLMKALFSLARMLLFQWTVLNVTSLFVSISLFGVPAIQYSPLWAFVVTVISALVHYVLFVRYYLRKQRAFVYWRFRDCFLVVFPLAAFCLGAGMVFLMNFVSYPPQELLKNFLIACILLCAFAVIGVPFALYTCVLIPYQRRMRAKQYLPGAAASPIEEAIRRECDKAGLRRDEMESLMLVGEKIDRIEGLDRATKLQRLYLSRNKISSTKGLQKLSALHTLHLEDNHISTFMDLLPLRGLQNLRQLCIERNPLCSLPGFELAQLVSLLPQLTSVNSLNITPEFRDSSRVTHREWLHELLCAHHKEVFDQNMPVVGAFLHNFLVRRSSGAWMQPVREMAVLTEQHAKPHVTFYNSLLDMKRHSLIVQMHPPMAAKPVPREKLRESKLLSVEWGSPDNL